MQPLLNHIISFANVSDIDLYLERYKKAGFHVDPQTVRHAPGKRNRFVNFGADYIEFFWVEDKKLFASKAKNDQKYFRNHPRPFGIAWESKSVDAFHKSAVKKGFKLKPTWSKAMREAADDKPWWAFQDISIKYLPGAWAFMLTYLRRDWKKVRTVSIPPNTIYGLTGITFITRDPETRAKQWKKFLGGGKIITARNIAEMNLGPHILEWVTEDAYRDRYGLVRSPLQKNFANMQEIALIHLVAADLRKAEAMLRKGGFKIEKGTNDFFIKPDKRDGFAFLVSELSPQKWFKTREGYGQKLRFK